MDRLAPAVIENEQRWRADFERAEVGLSASGHEAAIAVCRICCEGAPIGTIGLRHLRTGLKALAVFYGYDHARAAEEHAQEHKEKSVEQEKEPMRLVDYGFLKSQGVVNNRVTLARIIDRLNFPKPIQIGENRLAWEWEEVESWIASRPRRVPNADAPRGSADRQALADA